VLRASKQETVFVEISNSSALYSSTLKACSSTLNRTVLYLIIPHYKVEFEYKNYHLAVVSKTEESRYHWVLPRATFSQRIFTIHLSIVFNFPPSSRWIKNEEAGLPRRSEGGTSYLDLMTNNKSIIGHNGQTHMTSYSMQV